MNEKVTFHPPTRYPKTRSAEWASGAIVVAAAFFVGASGHYGIKHEIAFTFVFVPAMVIAAVVRGWLRQRAALKGKPQDQP